jgi:hypothetical protein
MTIPHTIHFDEQAGQSIVVSPSGYQQFSSFFNKDFNFLSEVKTNISVENRFLIDYSWTSENIYYAKDNILYKTDNTGNELFLYEFTSTIKGVSVSQNFPSAPYSDTPEEYGCYVLDIYGRLYFIDTSLNILKQSIVAPDSNKIISSIRGNGCYVFSDSLFSITRLDSNLNTIGYTSYFILTPLLTSSNLVDNIVVDTNESLYVLHSNFLTKLKVNLALTSLEKEFSIDSLSDLGYTDIDSIVSDFDIDPRNNDLYFVGGCSNRSWVSKYNLNGVITDANTLMALDAPVRVKTAKFYDSTSIYIMSDSTYIPPPCIDYSSSSSGGQSTSSSSQSESESSTGWALRVTTLNSAHSFFSPLFGVSNEGKFIIMKNGSGSGLFRSDNYGINFSHITGIVPFDNFTATSCSSDGTYVYAFAYNTENSNDDIICISSDRGLTWTVKTFDPSIINFIENMSSLGGSCCSSDGSVVYVTGYRVLAGYYAKSFVLYSPDYGVSWSILNSTIKYTDTSYQKISCSSDGTKIILAEQTGVVHFSSDSGLTWSDIYNVTYNVTGYNYRKFFISQDGNKIYGINNNKIVRSIDSGVNWTDLSYPTEIDIVYAIDYSSVSSTLVIVGNKSTYPFFGGMFVSYDEGATFELAKEIPSASPYNTIYNFNWCKVADDGERVTLFGKSYDSLTAIYSQVVGVAEKL